MINLIVAMDKNGLIGKDHNLPWNIKEELTFFKSKTMNKFLLMGETTFLALPKHLTGRKIIVLSKNKQKLGYKTINNFDYINKQFANSKQEIYISGGKSIYEQFYKKATTIYISILNKEYVGNVYLHLDLSEYKRETYQKFSSFTVYKYIKIKY